MESIIERGGADEERLYLYDLWFDNFFGCQAKVTRTDMANIADIIARHKARYHLPAFFCRPEMRVLDFPCGSGYAANIFDEFNVWYDGKDIDEPTLEYAKICHGRSNKVNFSFGDLEHPHLDGSFYDVIACIEGLEHIEKECQDRLISEFKHALKPGGVLVISSPEGNGKNLVNLYHLWELTRGEFTNLLNRHFNDVQQITHTDTLHNGIKATCLYGICRKGA